MYKHNGKRVFNEYVARFVSRAGASWTGHLVAQTMPDAADIALEHFAKHYDGDPVFMAICLESHSEDHPQ